MTTRIGLLIAAMCVLSGCLMTPRVEFPEHLSFDHIEYDIQPMSYNDVLCQA